MSANNSDLLGLPPSVWVVMVVALGGALVVHQHPFVDTRPNDRSTPLYQHAPSEDQDVEARIWEDPLAAVAIARNTEGGEKSADPTQPHSVAHLGALVAGRVQHRDRLLIVGALLPGAPYAYDAETRRRTRYAALAGFQRAGFVPMNSEHLGYVTLAQFYPGTPHPHDIAAYEWLQQDGIDSAPPAYLLLLWLDQDGFREQPLQRFYQIVTTMLPPGGPLPDPNSDLSAAILGPADSDGLKAMTVELAAADVPTQQALQRITVYSPRATASDDALLGHSLHKCKQGAQSAMACDPEVFTRISLFRGIASDDHVIRAIESELAHRGIGCGSITLVAERDSFYGRQMADYFRCDTSPSPAATIPPSTDLTSGHPQSFTYLRGLDGLTPPPPNNSQAADSSSPTAGGASSTSSDGAPPASDVSNGPAQLDYLRRLTAQLASHSSKPCVKTSIGEPSSHSVPPCDHHIKAIGVLGSDVYDKLLILQALRPAFPRAIFFTTDLDARLLDRGSLQWTQHLIVGSSLGLTLLPALQDGMPPFRDGYQSAAYYSTMLAANRFLHKPADPNCWKASSHCGLQWTQRPHIYEIGGSQAFDLTRHPDPDASPGCDFNGVCNAIVPVQPAGFLANPSRVIGLKVSGGVAIALALAAWTAFGRRRCIDAVMISESATPKEFCRRIVTWMVVLSIVGLPILLWPPLVQNLTDQGARNPLPLLDGASPWTGGLFQLLCLVAVTVLVIRGQRMLDRNSAEIHTQFGLPVPIEELVKIRDDEIAKWGPTARLREHLWFPISRLTSDSGPLKDAPCSQVEQLIGRYLHRGLTGARVLRVSIATMVVIVSLLVVEAAYDVPLLGGAKILNWTSHEGFIIDVIAFLALIALQFLVFWVADAMMLSRAFLIELSTREPKWPPLLVNKEVKRLSLSKRGGDVWLNLNLVACRTRWVMGLVWYPSVIIIAMAIFALFIQLSEISFASNLLVLIASAALVIASAVSLRASAEEWRRKLLVRLDDARIRQAGLKKSGLGPTSAQLALFFERLNSLSEGAFAPYSQQPAVRAVIAPVATYAATLGAQYFHLSV